MIQRIQSFYLLLAAVAGVLTFVFPVASYQYSGDLEVVFRLVSRAAQPDLDPFMFLGIWPYVLITGFLALVFLSMVIIFLYRNRRRQMRLTMIAVFLNILMIITLFFTSDRLSARLNISANPSSEVVYGIASYLPVLSLLFLMLAFRGIRKDERLIRSVDRIR